MKKLITLVLVFISFYGWGQTTTTPKSIDSYSIYPGDLSNFKFYGSKDGKAYNVFGSMIRDTATIGQSFRNWVIAQGYGAGSVASFNSRTGAIVPQLSDYAAYYAALVHSHAVSDVTGLQAALDAKAAVSHTHAASDITAGTKTSAFISDFQSAVNSNSSVTAATAHAANTSNPHNVTASQVGLGNVNNTSDASKPVSTAQQTALNLKADQTALTALANKQDTIFTNRTLKGNGNDTALGVNTDTIALVSKVQADSSLLRGLINTNATAITLKSDIASPTFTGTPKISTDTIATKAYARSISGSGTTLTNNLTTNSPGTALDAQQGYVLKGLVDANTTKLIRSFSFQLGLGGGVAVATNVTRIVAERSGTITKVTAIAGIGPTGADFVADIKINGTSIWAATPANRIKIIAGATQGSQTSFNTAAITAGDVISIDIVSVGSTVAGQDILIQLIENL